MLRIQQNEVNEPYKLKRIKLVVKVLLFLRHVHYKKQINWENQSGTCSFNLLSGVKEWMRRQFSQTDIWTFEMKDAMELNRT